MKKTILIISILSVAINSFAQINFKPVFEGAGWYSKSNYGKYGAGKTSLITTKNHGVFVTHPASTKLYQCDKVLGKSCDISQRDFLILQKDNKYGVIDFDGKEIYPIKNELIPEYSCDTKKWNFIKSSDNSNNEKVQMGYFEEQKIYSDNSKLKDFLKKYKYVHSFENGYYWVSEDGEYDRMGGGLLSSDMKWIIPVSNDYWFKDYESSDYFEIIPTASKYSESPDEERHIVDFETGKRVFSRNNQFPLTIKDNKLIYTKQTNPNDRYETKQAVYDLSLQKELALLQYGVLNIFDNELVIYDMNDEKHFNGLYSLKLSKIILPVKYHNIERINERYIIATSYTEKFDYNKNNFTIFEKEISATIQKK